VPFAGYNDFDDCVARNRDKDSPDAYCGSIKRDTEDKAMYEVVDRGGMMATVGKAAAAALSLATTIFRAKKPPTSWSGRHANRDKTYLAPGEEPPEGVDVKQGKRGGRYYVGPKRGPGTRHPSPTGDSGDKPQFPHAAEFGRLWGEKARQAREGAEKPQQVQQPDKAPTRFNQRGQSDRGNVTEFDDEELQPFELMQKINETDDPAAVAASEKVMVGKLADEMREGAVDEVNQKYGKFGMPDEYLDAAEELAGTPDEPEQQYDYADARDAMDQVWDHFNVLDLDRMDVDDLSEELQRRDPDLHPGVALAGAEQLKTMARGHVESHGGYPSEYGNRARMSRSVARASAEALSLAAGNSVPKTHWGGAVPLPSGKGQGGIKAATGKGGSGPGNEAAARAREPYAQGEPYGGKTQPKGRGNPAEQGEMAGRRDRAAQSGGDRTYLKPGEQAPSGVDVQTGERGGKYYEGGPGRGGKPQQGPQEGRGQAAEGALGEAQNYVRDNFQPGQGNMDRLAEHIAGAGIGISMGAAQKIVQDEAKRQMGRGPKTSAPQPGAEKTVEDFVQRGGDLGLSVRDTIKEVGRDRLARMDVKAIAKEVYGRTVATPRSEVARSAQAISEWAQGGQQRQRPPKPPFKTAPGSRFSESGDAPDGRHVSEFEDEDLNPAELWQKVAGLTEDHDDAGAKRTAANMVKKVATELIRATNEARGERWRKARARSGVAPNAAPSDPMPMLSGVARTLARKYPGVPKEYLDAALRSAEKQTESHGGTFASG
jgi:hypothetical protein